MQPLFADRLDALLDLAIALKREASERGHLVSAMSPDFAANLATAAGAGGAAVAEPYVEIAPGARFGFRRGTRPDLRIRSLGPPPGTLGVALARPTDSAWITLELDWPTAAFREKGGLRLLVRGRAAVPLSLETRVRAEVAGAEPRDVPGTPVPLGPTEATHVVEFPAPRAGLSDVPTLRALLFLPVVPFDLRLTSLRIL